jgi:SAM-dependent methyltransferase
MQAVKSYHETRLQHNPRREVLWKVLCQSYFQKCVKPGDCVLDLGAGHCHFVNHIQCARRIAVDRWEGTRAFATDGVETHITSLTYLGCIPDCSVNFVFASNVFEHLTQDEFAEVLSQLRRKLRPGGTLNILQPNYRFAFREYFDDYTHVAVYSDRSLSDFLAVNGFRVIECKPRFLPLTIKSRLPVSPFLIRLYLRLPFKPMGKQMLLRAAVE